MELLDKVTLRNAVKFLAERDSDLAAVVTRHGPPPLWARPPGFSTLTRIILEQQISLSSARAAYNRLTESIGEPVPEAFLTLSDVELKSARALREYLTVRSGSTNSMN